MHDVRSIIENENFDRGISLFLKTVVSVFKEAKEINHAMQDRNKRQYDKQRRQQPTLNIGTKVLVTTHALSQATKGITAKFLSEQDSSYVIISKIGSSLYEVAVPDDLNISLATYHASDLTIYNKSDHNVVCPTPVSDTGLLHKRGRRKKNSDYL